MSPDCDSGKHFPACTGEAWDKDYDEPVRCGCGCGCAPRRVVSPALKKDFK